MDRDLLGLMPTFIAVAETASFTAAANRLRQSPSAVSQAVRQLERRLGQPLFRRTTRSVSLTEAGADLLRRARPALTELSLALETAASAGGKPAGLLRLNVPRLAMPLVLEPVLPVMRQRYPDLAIEIFCEEASVDIVAEGFDAGIRVGSMMSPDMITVALTPPLRAILVAAPAYLDRRGAPTTLADLAGHDAINFRQSGSGRIYSWELIEDGRDIEVRAPDSLIINDSVFNLTLARLGLGIAYVFEQLAAPDLAAGRLVQLLPEAALTEAPLCLYFPRYANEQPKLRAFIDTARAVLRPAQHPT